MDVNKQLLDAANIRAMAAGLRDGMGGHADTCAELMEQLAKSIAAAEQAQQAEPVARDDDMVLIPRGLVGAACSAIDKKRDAQKVLALLRDVAMSKAAQPPAVAVPDVIEQIAQQWDECMYDSADCCHIDIGQAIRQSGQRLAAAPQATAEDSSVVRDAVSVPDELTCEDIERLRLALSWEGYSTPEGLENCAARWPSLVRDLIAGVLDRKKHAQSAAQKGGQ